MRATVLKQTGRNVAAFRRFYSSIDRAALPAPFPCLYRPFPCSPLLSSPFLPFLPPLSRFFFVPSLSLSLSISPQLVVSSFSSSIQRHISFFIRTSGYEPSELDSSSPFLFSPVFIYFPPHHHHHHRHHYRDPSRFPSLFVLHPRFRASPLSAQLFNLPRADAARLGATSPLSYLPLPLLSLFTLSSLVITR